MTEPVRRIALVKLGAMGDCVNSLPFVNRLRAGLPDACITWVIGRAAHALLAGHSAVDEFLVAQPERARSWLGLVRELRRRRFDLAIDLQRIAKSGALTRLTGAPRRLGFDRSRCKEASFLFTNERIAPNDAPGVTVAQYLEFADHLGLPPSEPRWDVPYEPFAFPVEGAGARIVLNLGASKPANLWPAERWGELALRLARDEGARVAFTGGPEDRSAAEVALAALAGTEAGARARVSDQVGRLSWKRTAGLLAGADLFVGGDTGPLHVAVAVGTPVLALFGAADPRRTGPFDRPDAVISRPAPCSPCRRRECNVAGHPCMTDIRVEDVSDRVAAAIAGPPRREFASS